MRRAFGIVSLFGVAMSASSGSASAELPPLIARDILFGNPERANPQLSPDGKRLAWLAPDDSGVLQIWVRTVGSDDGKPVTASKKRPVHVYFWAEDSQHLLYQQDTDGDENFHTWSVNLATGNVRDLTPWQGVRSKPAGTSARHPDRVLVALNLRDRRLLDVYRIDLRTGAVELDTQNPGDVVDWSIDDDLVVRGARVSLTDGGTELRVRTGARANWTTLLRASQDESVRIIDFSKDGKRVYLSSSLGSDTARLLERDLAAGKEREIARSEDVDVGKVMVHPMKRVIQAVGFAKGRNQWTVIDPSIKEDFERIRTLSEGDFEVVSRDRADKTWVVGFDHDRGPYRWYVWDRAAKTGTFLFVHKPKLEGLPLAERRPIVIRSRDGLELNSYMTLPLGVAPRNLPMVLYVHGGPWARDEWGYDPTAQWFANRGYAVLQVNYRASTGFGKKFLHAGDREWGRKMHDDLVDAVHWAIAERVADPTRVAIFGGSYGGYAALAGATLTPDLFRCSVAIAGIANIFTWVKNFPPYWLPFLGVVKQRVGNIDDPKDKEMLERASPLFSANKIKIPLLIGQGANDPFAPQRESEQIVAAVERNAGRATYVLYTDEGHGFQRPENRLDFFARAEAFLAENLGGRSEMMMGDRNPGSTAVVKYIGQQ